MEKSELFARNFLAALDGVAEVYDEASGRVGLVDVGAGAGAPIYWVGQRETWRVARQALTALKSARDGLVEIEIDSKHATMELDNAFLRGTLDAVARELGLRPGAVDAGRVLVKAAELRRFFVTMRSGVAHWDGSDAAGLCPTTVEERWRAIAAKAQTADEAAKALRGSLSLNLGVSLTELGDLVGAASHAISEYARDGHADMKKADDAAPLRKWHPNTGPDESTVRTLSAALAEHCGEHHSATQGGVVIESTVRNLARIPALVKEHQMLAGLVDLVLPDTARTAHAVTAAIPMIRMRLREWADMDEARTLLETHLGAPVAWMSDAVRSLLSALPNNKPDATPKETP